MRICGICRLWQIKIRIRIFFVAQNNKRCYNRVYCRLYRVFYAFVLPDLETLRTLFTKLAFIGQLNLYGRKNIYRSSA